MKHVYIIESLSAPGRFYVGSTADVLRRLSEHNSGESSHSAKFKPWALRVTITFQEDFRAHAFERYLKTGSGRAFQKRHFA